MFKTIICYLNTHVLIFKNPNYLKPFFSWYSISLWLHNDLANAMYRYNASSPEIPLRASRRLRPCMTAPLPHLAIQPRPQTALQSIPPLQTPRLSLRSSPRFVHELVMEAVSVDNSLNLDSRGFRPAFARILEMVLEYIMLFAHTM